MWANCLGGTIRLTNIIILNARGLVNSARLQDSNRSVNYKF